MQKITGTLEIEGGRQFVGQFTPKEFVKQDYLLWKQFNKEMTAKYGDKVIRTLEVHDNINVDWSFIEEVAQIRFQMMIVDDTFLTMRRFEDMVIKENQDVIRYDVWKMIILVLGLEGECDVMYEAYNKHGLTGIKDYITMLEQS